MPAWFLYHILFIMLRLLKPGHDSSRGTGHGNWECMSVLGSVETGPHITTVWVGVAARSTDNTAPVWAYQNMKPKLLKEVNSIKSS